MYNNYYTLKHLLKIGPNLNKIVNVLQEVKDWEVLANQLNFTLGNINEINSDCFRGASCCRMELVIRYCNAQGLQPEEIAENIAAALEEIGYKSQASRLRKLFISHKTDKGSEFYNYVIVSVYTRLQ